MFRKLPKGLGFWTSSKGVASPGSGPPEALPQSRLSVWPGRSGKTCAGSHFPGWWEARGPVPGTGGGAGGQEAQSPSHFLDSVLRACPAGSGPEHTEPPAAQLRPHTPLTSDGSCGTLRLRQSGSRAQTRPSPGPCAPPPRPCVPSLLPLCTPRLTPALGTPVALPTPLHTPTPAHPYPRPCEPLPTPSYVHLPCPLHPPTCASPALPPHLQGPCPSHEIPGESRREGVSDGDAPPRCQPRRTWQHPETPVPSEL